MPSYLDFNATSGFRNFLIGRTLQQPNGPQTFTASNYIVQNLSDFPNVDPGDVETVRPQQLLQTQNSNIFKPLQFFIVDNLNTLPRRANLSLYPYFTADRHNLVGIMNTSNYDTESELFKFAAYYIREDRNGPVFARISQNLETATTGRFRLLDALNGNTTTAINLLTGREPLIEGNNKITVAKTVPGKGIDFLKTVSGVELPFSTIPGDYLSNPANPINYRPQASTEVGRLLQDTTGAIGSLLGIPRRPTRERKPSDLFIEYMGDNQKKQLFDLLTYSKYGPNYTTTARSQNSSKVFNFVDGFAQGVKNTLGLEAPASPSYIGDDRGNDVRYAMGDFYDRPVRSSFYLSLMFDETQAILFQSDKNTSESGQISGKLTWISKNSKNKLGVNNENFSDQRSKLEDSLSTKYGFREDSILAVTQEILDTMPSNGGEARSHVANVIDQTSRVFREGDVKMSRGSAIKYIDKFSGEESGVEYCRVWTKDRPYFTMSDTMKRTSNIRKFEDSVLGGESRVWNINIAPMSNGNKSFDGSTNIVDGYQFGGGYYARKYMFSIENLAWKTSNREGFTVQDLPYCERGPNGGRVMWFPPYDLKVSEQNNAKWEENNFLGRPEPIYTYQNTSRSGQISFKVIVDHPSILNLLVKEHFKDMSDEEADNYINAFFAGCEDVDLYDLVRRYTTLDQNDIKLIQQYLNDGVDKETITRYKSVIDPVTTTTPNSDAINTTPVSTTNNSEPTTVQLSASLKFRNDYPIKIGGNEFKSGIKYSDHYDFISNEYKTQSATLLSEDLTTLITNYLVTYPNGPKTLNDVNIIYGDKRANITLSNSGQTITNTVNVLNGIYSGLTTEYTAFTSTLQQLKSDISGKTIQSIVVELESSTSAIADNTYNMKLSYRRSYSIIWDILTRISNKTVDDTLLSKLNWSGFSDTDNRSGSKDSRKLSFKDLGYDSDGYIEFRTLQVGENSTVTTNTDCTGKNQFQSIPRLNLHAPISVACRQTLVNLKYTKTPIQPTQPTQSTVVPPPVIPTTKLVEDGFETISSKPKKPPIDVMKRIIMKALSECYYFKKLEETSPVQFASLREKLKYFHPAFHSMTPEGLNARLTFLNQCLRPGDTIPIKGLVEESDLTARNTTFGPPPVCVVRIGDFYHSKVIIRDVNITFDDSPWDLNPEGIGVQPMIANVQLQVHFIGGHGLAKPVERLQNALSSNFYANTEMYDERSISTNKKIDGKDADQFTKEFLEDLQKREILPPINIVDGNINEKPKEGYIGILNESTSGLTYTNLVDGVFILTKQYFNNYKISYNENYKKYGSHLTSLLFSPNYRTISTYDVYETANGTSTTVLDLIGLYPKSKELPTYLRGLKSRMVEEIEYNISSITKDVFGFNILESKVPNSDNILKPYLSQTIQFIIDSLITSTSLTERIEDTRDNLISNLDKLNYLVYYVDHDGTISNNNYKKLNLSGYTSAGFFSKYSEVIEYLSTKHIKLTEKINNTVDFNNIPAISQSQIIEIILQLLSGDVKYKTEILNLYSSDKTVFRPNHEIKEIEKGLNKKLELRSDLTYKFKKFPIFDGKEITYNFSLLSDITDETEKDVLKKINSSKVNVTNKLNYYKKP